VNASTRHEANFAGDFVQRTVNAGTWMQFLNFWTLNANANLGIPPGTTASPAAVL
jgi:hypothetical protein